MACSRHAYKRRPAGKITYVMEGADAPTDLSPETVRKTLLQRIQAVAGKGGYAAQYATAHLISRFYESLLAQVQDPGNYGASRIKLSGPDLEEREKCLLDLSGDDFYVVAVVEAEGGKFRARSPYFFKYDEIEYSTDNDIFPTVEDLYSITIKREDMGQSLVIDFEYYKKNDGQQMDESGGEPMAAFTDLCRHL